MQTTFFTLESDQGVYVTRNGSAVWAHVFRHEFLAEMFINGNTKDCTLKVVPILNLASWLNLLQPEGVTCVLEHCVSDTHPHKLADWIETTENSTGGISVQP